MSNAVSPVTELAYIALHTIKIRGFATADQIAESSGKDVAALTTQLEALTEQGEVKYKSGRITGYMLTAGGRARLTELRDAVVTPADVDGLGPAYEAFLAPNAAFKQLTTDSQLGDIDQAALVSRLEEVHRQATAVVGAATAVLPRYGHYQVRLNQALDRFTAGDASALAKPMSASYHDVWMELHEDFLAVLGRGRTEEDG
jgi:hypothetical protein